MKTKLAIIGAGRVGSTIANNILYNKPPHLREITLMDIDERRRLGELWDLIDAKNMLEQNVVFSKTLSKSDVVIITAGHSRGIRSQEGKNTLIVLNIALDIVKYCPKAKVYVATNPHEKLYKYLKELGINAFELGNRLHKIRKYHTGKDIIAKKGYTNWGVGAEAYNILWSEFS